MAGVIAMLKLSANNSNIVLMVSFIIKLIFAIEYNSNFIGAQGGSNAIFGQGSGSIWLSDVGCSGTEGRILECSTGTVGGHTCSHSDDAGVTCSTC